MTRAEIRLSVLRTQVISLEDYGFHVFLWRWWKWGVRQIPTDIIEFSEKR
jgi:hypothetical protein